VRAGDALTLAPGEALAIGDGDRLGPAVGVGVVSGLR